MDIIYGYEIEDCCGHLAITPLDARVSDETGFAEAFTYTPDTGEFEVFDPDQNVLFPASPIRELSRVIDEIDDRLASIAWED